jgi:hypothetical protein
VDNLKYLFTISFLFLFYAEVSGQAWVVEENNFETNWNMTLQTGTSALLTETTGSLGHWGNEMSNSPGAAINFQIAKMVWERVDIGIEAGYSTLNGTKSNPSRIVYLNQHPVFFNNGKKFLPKPLNYNTQLINYGIFTKYNFINFSTWALGFLKINIFTRLGIGALSYQSELNYNNTDAYVFTGLPQPLYSANEREYPGALTFYVYPAFGLNYQLNDRIFLSAELSTQFYSTGNLDGIPRYSGELTPESTPAEVKSYYKPTNTLSAKLLLGVTYFFNFNSTNNKRMKEYPWFSSRYRSYYSKYQPKSTKKERQQWLPFFNEKFEND